MAKKGGSPHYIRIRAPSSLAIAEKKEKKWLLSPSPGPHAKDKSVSLAVLLRDVLKVCSSISECKKVLGAKRVLVNGVAQKEPKFPVGLMDVVSFPSASKHYRMSIRAGKLQPAEISQEDAAKSVLKIVQKRTIGKGKVCVTFHNGRNMLADNDLKVGDTVVLSGGKISQVIKLKSGVRCLITSGKHAGEIAQFEELIERKGSMDAEAKLKGTQESFVTVAKYLFAVDNSFN